jgi:hypothetical protein
LYLGAGKSGAAGSDSPFLQQVHDSMAKNHDSTAIRQGFSPVFYIVESHVLQQDSTGPYGREIIRGTDFRLPVTDGRKAEGTVTVAEDRPWSEDLQEPFELVMNHGQAIKSNQHPASRFFLKTRTVCQDYSWPSHEIRCTRIHLTRF